MPIGTWLAKAHAYAFYVLRGGSFKGGFPEWKDWSGLVFLTVAMFSAALTVTNVLSNGFQHLLVPREKGPFITLWGLIAAVIGYVNYYTLIAGRKWSRFEAEFQHYSKTMRVLGGIAVWASLVLIVEATLWTGQIAFRLPRYPIAT